MLCKLKSIYLNKNNLTNIKYLKQLNSDNMLTKVVFENNYIESLEGIENLS
jgi:hypothetical protein